MDMVFRKQSRIPYESLAGEIIVRPHNNGRVCCVPKWLCQRLDLEPVPAEDHRAGYEQAPGLNLMAAVPLNLRPWCGGCAPASIEDCRSYKKSHGGCAPDVQLIARLNLMYSCKYHLWVQTPLWGSDGGRAVAAANMFAGRAKQCNAGRGKAGQGRIGGQASWCYERHPVATCTLQPQNARRRRRIFFI